MALRRWLFLLPLALTAFASCALAQQAAYLDTKLSPAERAHDLVGRMTLDEKSTQLEDWATAIPRLGIPDYQTWNEALHGVAPRWLGHRLSPGHRHGRHLGPGNGAQHGQCRLHRGQGQVQSGAAGRRPPHLFGLTFWSPNINIFRDPRWGRGQETYGEDPFLTAKLGVAFIGGVQGGDLNHLRAVATSKHFAVHSGPEQLRHGFNVDPSPRDLEETYLPAFRATVTEGHVQSVMCAYNSIDAFRPAPTRCCSKSICATPGASRALWFPTAAPLWT